MQHIWERALQNKGLNQWFAQNYEKLAKKLVKKEGDRDILHDVYLKMTTEGPPGPMPEGRAAYLFYWLMKSYALDSACSPEQYEDIFGYEAPAEGFDPQKDPYWMHPARQEEHFSRFEELLSGRPCCFFLYRMAG